MPKVTVREDGTAFIRARIHPGSDVIRAWEVTREGIGWLRKRGVGVEQEMGRSLFDQLRKLKYAYIANPSGQRSPNTRRRKISSATLYDNGVKVETEIGPERTRRIITVPARLVESASKPGRKRRGASTDRRR